ncbi:MAG: hypothetical protein KGL04_00015 [Elusimicrobia bacterium]|nr:hypothetical protein [Elusimicrobiota bacterium]MDE2312542.1 hypothetical protein [Elusimicrobiota bacterium]
MNVRETPAAGKTFWPDKRLSACLGAAGAGVLGWTFWAAGLGRLSWGAAAFLLLAAAYAAFWYLSHRVTIDDGHVAGFLDPHAYLRRPTPIPLASAPLRVKIPLQSASVCREEAPQSGSGRLKIRNVQEPKFPKITVRFLRERDRRELQAEIESRRGALEVSPSAAPAGSNQE